MKSKLSSLITMLLVSLFCDLNLWSLVSSTCLQYELPSSSVYALILVESQGDAQAVGDDGKALGLAQFHQGTFEWLSDKYGKDYRWPEDALDEEKSIDLLCASLADGRAGLWHGWRSMNARDVPEREHFIWDKTSQEQFDYIFD